MDALSNRSKKLVIVTIGLGLVILIVIALAVPQPRRALELPGGLPRRMTEEGWEAAFGCPGKLVWGERSSPDGYGVEWADQESQWIITFDGNGIGRVSRFEHVPKTPWLQRLLERLNLL
jgi:hypothetical protein